jgi:hypothetical protein
MRAAHALARGLSLCFGRCSTGTTARSRPSRRVYPPTPLSAGPVSLPPSPPPPPEVALREATDIIAQMRVPRPVAGLWGRLKPLLEALPGDPPTAALLVTVADFLAIRKNCSGTKDTGDVLYSLLKRSVSEFGRMSM